MADRVKEQFIGGDTRVQLVASAPRELYRRLLGSEEEVDKAMLADIFPEPAEHGHKKPTEPEAAQGSKRRRSLQNPSRATPGNSYRAACRWIRGATDKSAALRSDTLQLDVALDCDGGDPFKAYEVFDFDLSATPIEVAVDGGEVIERKLNRIVTRVGNGFRLQVTGVPLRAAHVTSSRARVGTWVYAPEQASA